MRYLSEIRTFIIAIVGLLIVIAVAGFFVVMRFSEQFTDHYWNESQGIHVLIKTLIESGKDPSEYHHLLLGFVVAGKDGAVLRAYPQGAADFYRKLRPGFPVATSITEIPSLVPGSESTDTLVILSRTSDDRRMVTYHFNPLPAMRRTVLIYFMIIALVATGVPVLTFFFLTGRISKPFRRLILEAEQSPLAPKSFHEDPEFIFQTLQATIRELKQSTLQEQRRADALHVLAQTLSRNLPSGLIVMDNDGNIIRTSPAAETLLSLHPSEEPVHLRGLQERWPVLHRYLDEVHLTRKPLQRLEFEDGSTKFAATIVPLSDEANLPLGTLAIFVDMTEMVRLEEDLRRQRSMAELGVFASGIAHEFRNSLATLRGYLDLFRTKRQDHYLDEVSNEVSLILKVINRFLEFASHHSLVLEPIQLDRLIFQVTERLKTVYPDVHVKLSCADLTIPGDGTLLEQALRNIFENSFQLAKSISIRAGKNEKGDVFVEVEDDGPGIPEELRETLALPFVSGKADGVGLGLAIASKVIQEHDGSMKFSNLQDGGTLCRMILSSGR
ncbi:MAG TPA: ATP-binding protein [Thermoanaerobaculia bacterium]|nr:ATP-binding protein [Thermoanaerobaculia bacterium]HUM31041.1 ATP-binding protein [Thermoanaerobaculia bacterium]HXK69339.1 ATP-binding protein [Thermoanaerobaculia bacterium]